MARRLGSNSFDGYDFGCRQRRWIVITGLKSLGESSMMREELGADDGREVVVMERNLR